MTTIALFLALVLPAPQQPSCESFTKIGVASSYTVTVCDGQVRGRGQTW